MEIVNLTAHPLNFVSNDGQVILTVPPSGTVTRVATDRQLVGTINTADDNLGDDSSPQLAITVPNFGQITDLPDPQAGTIFVVSAMVAIAAGRDDVFSPGDLVRGPGGQPVGCRGLTRQ